MGSREIGLAFHSSVIDELVELGLCPELGLPAQKPGCEVSFQHEVPTFCAFRVQSVLLWFASTTELKAFGRKLEARFSKTLRIRGETVSLQVLDLEGPTELPSFQVIRTLFFSMKINGADAMIGVSLCA